MTFTINKRTFLITLGVLAIFCFGIKVGSYYAWQNCQTSLFNKVTDGILGKQQDFKQKWDNFDKD
jgi:hypothetical protein